MAKPNKPKLTPAQQLVADVIQMTRIHRVALNTQNPSKEVLIDVLDGMEKNLKKLEQILCPITTVLDVHDGLCATAMPLSRFAPYLYVAILNGKKIELQRRECVELFEMFPPEHPVWESIIIENQEDHQVCEECWESIPILEGGGLNNRHHKPSCSLYDPSKE